LATVPLGCESLVTHSHQFHADYPSTPIDPRQGVFMGGGKYGHLNAYPYQFVTRKISNVAVVIKGMKSRDEEKKRS